MFDIITIGDSLMDIFLILNDEDASCLIDKKTKKLCFNYADKISIRASTHSVGGNAANVAVGMKKTGLKTALVTELGDDVNGLMVADEIKKAGVDTSMVKIHQNKETRYSVVLNYHSERTILSYHSFIKYSFPKLPAAKWIYYTSLGKSFEFMQDKLSAYLKKHHDTKLAMNPGSYQFKYGLHKIRQMIPACDILIVNKEEATKLAEKSMPIKALFKELHKAGAKIVVITDSADGSYASDGSGIYYMQSYPVKPVAKTGAGDAYTSGFLSAIIKNKSIIEAMQWGTANSAGVIQKYGAQKGLLNQAQILRVIQKYTDIGPIMF